MTWGIAGAVEEEVRCIIDNLSEKSVSQWGRRLVYTGKIKDQDVIVMATGVGKVKTSASIQYLLDHFPIEAVIFTGMAGAVNPGVKVGDIVISQKVVQHDFDLAGKGIVEEMKTPWFEADPELVNLAVRASSELGFKERVRLGTVLTGDQAVVDSKKREWLWETFRGDCVEMEGAAVASVCSQNKIPFVLIRAITDLADENARDDFHQTMSKACTNAANIVLGMLGLGVKAEVCKNMKGKKRK
ncbi:MAG: 5'-methylthioadenosine/adenosylhomocysteine nucleosidase [Candidatus Aminicenantes bacterium]|nr:5'-methylthioadenosine/adenosylhomocysteine nucleosidase [Candidatus Aminicenantes bacterium]MDH5384655.1 5'-methylthioadenosine/adenosylhomocysteine nucleosidase [Candidatus Aminicenantes bacterium]